MNKNVWLKIIFAIIFLVGFVLFALPTFADDCVQPQSLPLLTHYQNGIGFSLTGVDQPSNISNMYADEQYLRGDQSVPFYNNFFPTVNNYIGMNYDEVTFPNEQVSALLIDVCKNTGVPFRLIQPGIELTKRSDLENIVGKDLPYVQVLHSLVIGNNLFTFVIPPNWNPQKTYPLFINGFYGLNDNFVRLEGKNLLTLIGQLYQENKLGAIGILWNGGGSIASRTVNDNAYQFLNIVMTEVIPALGIDPERVISFGESRGGVTALNIASHSDITSFKVRYVNASVPPNDIALMGSLAGPTIPELMYASDWSTGYSGSWRNDFRYPDTIPELSGLTGAQAHEKVLTGTFDPTILKNRFNLSSPVKIKNLLERKTEVYLEIGSNDFIVPFVDEIHLMRAYNAANIPLETRINYLAGHWENGTDRMARLLIAGRQLSSEILNGKPKESLVTAQKIEPYILGSNGSLPVPYSQATHRLPLSLDIPRYINENVNSFVIATGEPGKSYRMIFEDGVGNKSNIPFTLDKDGTWIWKIDPNSTPAGRYELVKVIDMDSNWALNLSRSSLPMTDNTVTDCVKGEIRQFGSRIENIIMQGYNGPNDEYHLKINGNTPASVSYGVVELM